jgi:hypothetical protein
VEFDIGLWTTAGVLVVVLVNGALGFRTPHEAAGVVRDLKLSPDHRLAITQLVLPPHAALMVLGVPLICWRVSALSSTYGDNVAGGVFPISLLLLLPSSIGACTLRNLNVLSGPATYLLQIGVLCAFSFLVLVRSELFFWLDLVSLLIVCALTTWRTVSCLVNPHVPARLV